MTFSFPGWLRAPRPPGFLHSLVVGPPYFLQRLLARAEPPPRCQWRARRPHPQAYFFTRPPRHFSWGSLVQCVVPLCVRLGLVLWWWPQAAGHWWKHLHSAVLGRLPVRTADSRAPSDHSSIANARQGIQNPPQTPASAAGHALPRSQSRTTLTRCCLPDSPG